MLTEPELAEIERNLAQNRGVPLRLNRRLVAELREARAELDRLRPPPSAVEVRRFVDPHGRQITEIVTRGGHPCDWEGCDAEHGDAPLPACAVP